MIDLLARAMMRSPLLKLTRLVMALMLAFGSLLAVPAVAAEAAPTITSDQADYPPGATVTLTGANWAPAELVRIVVNDTIGQSWQRDVTITASDTGVVTDVFQLPNYFVSNYDVTAIGPTSGTATTTFTDLSIGTYDQCSNDLGTGYASGDTGCRWINGNLQGNNSRYFEGDATVQRLWLTGLTNGAHSVTLQYGTTKGGKHAYDYLTNWDWSENWVTLADRCQDITNCMTWSTSTLQIPDDPNVSNTIEPVPGGRVFTMYNGSLTSASTPTIVSGSYAGDSETSITVSFNVNTSTAKDCTGSPLTCSVVLIFGAHVSSQVDWGVGNGAGSISGSPYHVSLAAVDGASVGSRDNQMQAGTIVANGTIVIVKDAQPNDAQDFSFTLTNGTTINQSFSLDDDSDATLPSSRSFSVPPGTYSAQETNIPANWSLAGLTCVDPTSNTTVNLASATASINLASGETVTCTYVDSQQNPNLTITKTADAATVNAGDQVGYTISVQNGGPGTANNVVLTDALPANPGLSWTVAGVTGSGGYTPPANACSISSGTLTCNFGSIGSGGSVSVHITSPTTPASCGTITNSASVTSSNGGTKSTGQVTITVNCPDVKVEKTADNSPIDAGDTAAFTIVVSNIGAGTAKNVTLNDPLPSGVTWSISPAVSGCAIASGTLSCSFATLAAGASVTIHVSGTTSAANCGTLPNTATVSATNEAVGANANNTSSATITVNCGSIQITKTADAASVSAGDPIGFTITVTNGGAGTAKGVTVSDTLPTNGGLSWSISPAVSGCAITSGVLTCNFGDLAAGASKSVHISSPTTPASCGTVSNTASVTTTNDGSGTASASVTVQCPSLTVTKTADAATVDAGDPIGFTITVSNGGPGVAKSVTLSDALPTGTGISWTISPAYAGPGTCAISAGALSCSFGDLAAGASVSIHITSPTTAQSCATYPNTATAQATNNAAVQASASVTVNCATIQISKTADASSVDAGDQIGFTITVTNGGVGTANGVVVNDTLPTNAGTSWTIDAGGSSSGCSISSGVLTCNFGSMAGGTSKHVHITSPTTPATCGTVDNTASVTTSNDGSGTASASITVNCPDVKVVKTAANGTINAGDTASFSIVVSNIGAGTAKGVTLSDTLPSGVVWSLGGPDAANCSISGSSLTCTFGDLAPNATRTITVSGTTDAADCGVLSNSASASATNEPSDKLANNTSSDSITVRCPDVVDIKTATTPTVSAGDPVAFSIAVSNNGPGTAYNVALNDPLPGNAGLDWDIVSASPGLNCTISGAVGSEVLSCSIASLAAGASVSVTVGSGTTAASCATISNTATASASNEPSANTGNNTSTASLTVDCPDVKVEKTADSGTINAGDTAAFTIVVTNIGAGIARNVTLTDNLPAGVAWSEDSADCSITAGVLSCSFGDLAAGATRTIHVSGTTDAADCGPLSNTATVSATNEPSNKLSNNSSTAVITVNCPNVTVVKTADSGTINAGDTASFTIVVSNSGPGAAYNVTLSDQLPAGVAWSVGGPDGAACSIDGNGLLTCSFGTLAAGASTTITVSGTTDPADCGTLTNSVTVAASNEANTADNSSTASITVSCPNVMVSKTADHSPINAGDTAAFTIVVSNIGQGTAYDVTLTDNLPAGVAWSISPAVTGCDIQTGTLSCSLGDLAAGASVEIHISGVTDAADCGVLSNTATVAATNEAAVAQGNNSSTATITVNCPQVVNLKTTSTATVSAGDLIKFSITVKNEGPGVAYNVTLSDPLPSGIAWSEDPDSADCTISGQLLSCTYGTLAANESRTVTVSGQSSAADCGVVTNTATASASNEPSSALGDNVSTATVTVLCPNVTVSKTADSGTISAGEVAAFTIVLANSGTGTAYNVTLTDNLPAGVAWALDPAVTGCAINSGVLSCSIASLATGASVTLHISGVTDAADCGVLTNTATASASNEAADNTADNSSSATITVDCPDVTVVKTADSGTINAGDTASFTIVVSNSGAGTAKGVTLTDNLPAGVAWSISPAVTGCDIQTGTLSCSLGDLAAGDSVTIHISGVTDAADCGTLHNLATVAATNERASDEQNNSDDADIVVNCPNVTVVKTAGSGTINAGDTASFTIVVSNSGTGTAKGVTLTDNLPAGVAWSISPAVTGCDIQTGTLSCSLGDLAAGASVTLHISGVTDAADCGVLSNTATVAASNEANTGDNSSTATITVQCPNVTVVKTADSGTINAGDTASFTIVVSNSGPGAAYNVTLSDQLPAGVAWSVGGADGAACSIDGNGLLTCSFGTLAAGASTTITVSGTTDPADCGTLTNSVTVAASNEANTADNSSTASITVSCPNVMVSKTADHSPINAGDTAAFTIVVSNIGQGTAYDVTLTDNLPAGVAWSISPAATGCDIQTGTLSCSLGDLAAGDSVTIHISGVTDAADCGVLSNTATVAATNEAAIAQGNNSSTATITVNCPQVVNLKTTSTATVSAGDLIKFSITVKNEGPGAAYNVTLSDPLPSGIAWSEDPDSADCTISGQLLSCTYGTLAANESRTVTVSGQSSAADCGVVTNTATASASNEPSSALGDNVSTATVTVLCPNVTVSKTADSGTISAGDVAAFTIVLANSGTGTAYNVTLTDNLPAGVAWALDPAVTGCAINSGVLSCSIASLATGASVTLHISGVTDAADCGVLTNTATASASNEAADNTADNSSSATITVDCPDVTVVKTADSGTINAGDTASFTIVVSNSGAGTAKGVTLTDNLPAGVAWSISPAVTGCDIQTGTLSCSLGDLAAGDSVTIHISGVTDAADCGTLHNLATVAATNERASDEQNNSDDADIVVNCPNVTVVKTADSGTINAGEVAAFTIVVSNSGTGTAYNVTLTDPLPAGVAWSISPAVTGCDIQAGTLSCSIASLAAGASVEIHISGVTDAADCGVLSNTATVAASNEANTGDNSSTAKITVQCPDVKVEKTADNSPINAGDTASFTIVVSNIGQGTAYNMSLTDNLPSGVAWSISPAVTGCDIQTGTLSCSFASLAAGASVEIHISGVTDAADCGVLSNTATVAASNEPASANTDNSSTAVITVNCPNVTVVKTADSGTINAGDTASFTIVVSNSGTGTAYNVTLTDSLPAGVAWSEDSVDCSITAGVLSCSFGSLASGATRTIHVSGTTDAADCGTLSNTATVAATNEANTGDNSSTATITVNCPNVKVVKTAANGTINAGDTASFTIVVSNSGTGTAYNVTLTDSLPAGVAWSEDSADCSITAGVLSCSFGSLASGATRTIHVSGTTDAADCGVLSNTATVAASNEPASANTDNSSTAVITVNCPNVTVVKTAANGTINAGDTASFTIVVSNNGAGIARNVTLTDNLPAGVAWSEDSADCSITAGVLSCSFGDLASGATRTIHVSGTTDAADCGVLINTATVAATNEASEDTLDNSSTATITVNCPDLTVTKTADAATVNAGESIGFTITVKNNGVGTAYGVSISDPLPTGTGISWSISPAASGCSITGNTLSCTFGNLAAGASKTVHVTSATQFASCKVYNNSATASATNEPGDKLADNSATATVTVNCPSLTVTKAADAATVNAGDPIGFTITVSNGGPGVAKSVTLNDPLPTGSGITWAISPAYAGPGTCAISTGTLSCSFGNLAAGASVSIHVTSPTQFASCKVYANTATATATNHPAVTGSASITVNCPKLVITKTANAAAVNFGSPIGFTITVKNDGPGVAKSVTLSDPLPTGAGIVWTISPAYSGPGTCAISAGTLSCSFGDMAAGASISIHITSPTLYACATYTNTAKAQATNHPQVQATATTSVNCLHPGTIGFWKNWRNQYSSTQIQALINYLKANNPKVYNKDLINGTADDLTIAIVDAIFNVGSGTPRSQMTLAQLTSVKLNLAITQLKGTSGLVQKNDNVCLAGLVNVSGISGAAALFGTSTPTIKQVVDFTEGKWNGKLSTKTSDWKFNLTNAQYDTLIKVLTGINEGTIVLTSGCA